MENNIGAGALALEAGLKTFAPGQHQRRRGGEHRRRRCCFGASGASGEKMAWWNQKGASNLHPIGHIQAMKKWKDFRIFLPDIRHIRGKNASNPMVGC